MSYLTITNGKLRIDWAASTFILSESEKDPCCCSCFCNRSPAGVTITFSEYPVNTTINTQYADKGIEFIGTFIANDGSNPSSPVLSGAPQFFGPVTGYFVDPITRDKVSRSSFSLAAGYFNNVDSTDLILYDCDDKEIKRYSNKALGIETFNVEITGEEKCIHRFVMQSVSTEDAGFAIDNVQF
jgi:hypothetical protein